MSVWVSHHLWQLLLSLTTLSAQEVISELDYHHQPHSVVSPNLTHTHTDSRAHMGRNGHVHRSIHSFSQTSIYLCWHSKNLYKQMYSFTPPLPLCPSHPHSLTHKTNISMKNIPGLSRGGCMHLETTKKIHSALFVLSEKV